MHNHGPDGLAVVEDLRVFLLTLCTVKETSQQADDDLFEEPSEQSPENKLVFIFEVLGVACL